LRAHFLIRIGWLRKDRSLATMRDFVFNSFESELLLEEVTSTSPFPRLRALSFDSNYSWKATNRLYVRHARSLMASNRVVSHVIRARE
jgi:hypothetical protein